VSCGKGNFFNRFCFRRLLLYDDYESPVKGFVMSSLKLLSTSELSARLTNKKNTIEGWRIKGFGPRYIKIGRLVRYRIEDIELWEESRICDSTTTELRGAK
jgi:predicted DNA-binding transcriptional regulator AlpA